MWRAELATQFRRRRTKALLIVLAAVPVLLVGRGVPVGRTRSGQRAHLPRPGHPQRRVRRPGRADGDDPVLPAPHRRGRRRATPSRARPASARCATCWSGPAGRTRLLLVKAGTAAVFCLVAALTVAVGGLIAGVDPFSHRPGHHAVGHHAVAGSTACCGPSPPPWSWACRCSAWPPSALFISTLTDVPVGAMAATVGLRHPVGHPRQRPPGARHPPVAVHPQLAGVRRPAAQPGPVARHRQGPDPAGSATSPCSAPRPGPASRPRTSSPDRSLTAVSPTGQDAAMADQDILSVYAAALGDKPAVIDDRPGRAVLDLDLRRAEPGANRLAHLLRRPRRRAGTPRSSGAGRTRRRSSP